MDLGGAVQNITGGEGTEAVGHSGIGALDVFHLPAILNPGPVVCGNSPRGRSGLSSIAVDGFAAI